MGRAAEDYWPLLRRVARVLARFPERRIRWEGHADPAEAGDDTRALALASMERAEWMPVSPLLDSWALAGTLEAS
jgi:outer membrane protein OmpA-like peptidoglycan-associated protein